MSIPTRLNVIGRSRDVAHRVYSNLEATNHKVTPPIKFFVYLVSVPTMTIAAIMPNFVLRKVTNHLRTLLANR